MQVRRRAAPSPNPPPELSSRLDRRPTPTPVQASRLTAEDWARARAAYLAPGAGTIGSVRAAGFGKVQAERLVVSGLPALGLRSLREEARLLIAKVEQKSGTLKDTAAEKLLEERRQATARVVQEGKAIVGDAEASRLEEVRLVRANRRSALVLAQVNGELLRTGLRVVESLERTSRNEAELDRLPPRERLGMLRTIATVVHRTAEVSARAVEMERLLMGEPTAILGHADPSPAKDMTPDEAEKWFELASRAFKRRALRATVLDVEPEPAEEPLPHQDPEDGTPAGAP